MVISYLLFGICYFADSLTKNCPAKRQSRPYRQNILREFLEGFSILGLGVGGFPVEVEEFKGGEGADVLVIGKASADFDLGTFDEVEFKTLFAIFADDRFVNEGFPIAGIFEDQAEDGIFELLGLGQRAEDVFGNVFAGVELNVAVEEGAERVEFVPCSLGVAFFEGDNDVKLVFGDFAKVHALDGAGVNDRGVCAFVEVLGLVDVPEGDVIEPGVTDKRTGENKVGPEEDVALTAEFCALYGGVGGEDGGEGGVGFFEPEIDEGAEFFFELGVHLVRRFGLQVEGGHHAGAGDPGQGEDLEGEAPQVGGAEKLGLVEDANVGDFEGAEGFEGVGASEGGGQVVIADEEEGGDTRAGQAHDPAAPFPLKGGGGGAVFVGISGKEDEVNFFGDGGVNDRIEGFEEVHHPNRETSDGVVAAIVGHVYVGVGKVEEFEHGNLWELVGFEDFNRKEYQERKDLRIGSNYRLTVKPYLSGFVKTTK